MKSGHGDEHLGEEVAQLEVYVQAISDIPHAPETYIRQRRSHSRSNAVFKSSSHSSVNISDWALRESGGNVEKEISGPHGVTAAQPREQMHSGPAEGPLL